MARGERAIHPAPVRYITAAAFVGAWMAVGWLLRLDTNAYLLLGIPLTVAFQRFVRRLPLRTLWVVDAPALRLRGRPMVVAAGLAVLPLVELVLALMRGDTAVASYEVAAVGGAVAAAYALAHFAVRRAFVATYGAAVIAVAGVIWSIAVASGLIALSSGGLAARVAVGVVSLLEYFAVCFVMEEVTFRALDRHLSADATPRGLPPAVFIAALWGLWHLPVAGEISIRTVAQLLAVHLPLGVLFSYAWRRTGNLVLPALGHALTDAIRNALIAAA